MSRTINIKPAKTIQCIECPIRKLAWFEPGSLNDIAQRQTLRSGQYAIRAGQIIYQEGDRQQEIYTLREGWVIRYKVLSGGQRQVLNVALPGDFIGFRSNHEEGIDHSAIAASNIELCAFSRGNAQELMASDPTLMMRLIEIQDTQAQACRNRLAYVGQAPAKQRLAMFLSDLLERLEQRGIDLNELIQFPLTREDIADAIGITPVHLSRISSELRKDNILDCRYGKLMIGNLDRLKNLAEEDGD
ncbi:MAG: Crp/Fnr family transcriptional regulator [bacterium]